MTTNHATVAWHEGMGALAIKSVALAVRPIGPNPKQVVFARVHRVMFTALETGKCNFTAYLQRNTKDML